MPARSRTNRMKNGAKKPPGKASGADASGNGRFVPGPEFTPHMVAKAKRLIDRGQFARLSDDTCQVPSSDGSSYLVSINPSSCQCASFKVRRICSHLLVMQMIAAASGDGDNGTGRRATNEGGWQ